MVIPMQNHFKIKTKKQTFQQKIVHVFIMSNTKFIEPFLLVFVSYGHHFHDSTVLSMYSWHHQLL